MTGYPSMKCLSCVKRFDNGKFERFSKEIFCLEGSGKDLVLSGIESKKVEAPVSLKDAGIPEENIEKVAETPV